MMMTLNEAIKLLPAARLIGAGDTAFTRVHTDTRSLAKGDLFVALKGEQFDAHSFLSQLKPLGCSAAIAEHDIASHGLNGIEVSDSRNALGELAQAWRKRFEIPLIAVTGSNGKTTVTQMLASILSAWHGEAGRLATQGNFNNDVGLPLTLLRLRKEHLSAVVEIGMNHIGEVTQLARMAAPTVALVNNAQREHQEFMGSVQAAARENGAVLEALTTGGIAVYPTGGDQTAYSAIWKSQSKHALRQVSFTLDAHADADVKGVSKQEAGHQTLDINSEWGRLQVRLSLLGAHNAHNALAAATAALAAGVPSDAIVQGLEKFTAVKGRLVRSDFAISSAQLTLIDDTYNANPDSVIAAIDALSQLPSPRWLVLGDMGEVGDKGAEFHAEVGAYARKHGVHQLFGLGELCVHAVHAFDAHEHTDAKVHATIFESRAALKIGISNALRQNLPGSILIKGSRFMAMEEFVAQTKSDVVKMGGVAC
jgi:UDP-N-acetylmuramoyl-tripeptide--D-alanyl-D-alanine ligase